MDLEQRVQRLEYLLIRLATVSPELLPTDAHEMIGIIIREIDCRDEKCGCR